MTVSVVEVVPDNFNASATSRTLALAPTPSAGDVVAVVFNLRQATGTTVPSAFGVSGLTGATWAQADIQASANGTSSGSVHALWLGTGATAAGTITASWTTGGVGSVRVFLIRGLTSTTVAALSNSTTGSVTGVYSGPASNAQAGQIVLDAQLTYLASTALGATTFVTPYLPTTGWTVQAQYAPTTNAKWGTGYRIPSETSATSHRTDLDNKSFSASGARITQWVIGTADTGTITGTVAATQAAHTAAIAGNTAPPTFTGTVAATRAPHTAAVAGTVLPPPVTGALAATGPAHTAAIDGAVSAPGTVVGSIDATGPAHTAAIAGDVAPPLFTGSLAATSPAHTASLAGDVLPPPVTGTLDATGPAHTAAIAGDVNGTGDATGVLAATRAPHQATIYGTVTSYHLRPWTADLSGRTLLPLVTSGSFDHTPPLALPPEGFTERVLWRRSVIVPPLHTIEGAIIDADTGSLRIPDDVYDALPVVEEPIGVPHVVFPNEASLHDITYWRGGITKLLRDSREEPFGDATLDIEIPRLTTMDDEPDDSGTHPLNWTRNRANVEIVFKRPDGSIRRGAWAGHVVAHDAGNTQTEPFRRLSCVGTLRQAATDVLQVPNILDPTDIGTLIPGVLNRVASRRYPKVANVSTGIPSTNRGAWSDNPLGHAQSLLATAWTDAGNQWTVAKVEGTRRTYEMRLKKTAPTWTITNGARGVEVDLTRDATGTRNVIYGHGVADDGYAWWGFKYPNLRADDAPAYPGSLMGLGASGAGVALWQERVRDLGWAIPVDGTISASDVKIIQAVQRRYGLSVDGVIGPQTWTATFDVGANGGDLTGVIRLPLAADPRTQRWIYNADGSIAGPNPVFDKNVLIYADDIDFGTGITRAEGVQSAQQIVDRESQPGLTGRIVLRTDPREDSRLFIAPGDKITLLGYEQADRVLHITAVERDWQSLTVTLTVDEKSRDAMTVAQIRTRNKEARRDPARRPGNVNRRSRLEVDQVVPFDGESGAGRIPKVALHPGLWSVIRIPVSEVGRVAKLDISTSAPTKFALALFGAPIQPAHLVAYVGADPLALTSPYETHRELLEDRFGFIESWGSSQEAAGEQAGVTFGRLLEGGFEYVSAKPPWIWVAMWSPNPTRLSGRILPAPIQ